MRCPACVKRILSLALGLCLAFQTAPAAFAQENDQRAEQCELSVLKPEELQEITEGVIQELQLNADNVSVGYCYTATGETWYYNGDKWYYSASLYKVPLMMILAEREHNGELTQESVINGLTLAYAEESILTYSNNDFAHLMMHYIGTDRECREQYQQFSTLPVEDYDPDFYDYSYFTPRFMTDVMMTLYYEQERFPNILDCLKNAQPGHYFRLGDAGGCEIAQKYGSYEEFNHTSGIVYTPNPFILTVMTRYTGGVENVIFTFKQRMQDYTLQLDGRLDQARADYERQQAEEEQRREEEERKAEEERQAEEERRAAEEQASAAPEPTQAPASEQTSGIPKLVLAAGAAVLLLVLLALVIIAVSRRRRRETVPAGGGRREAAEAPRRRRPAEKKGRNGYTPRH